MARKKCPSLDDKCLDGILCANDLDKSKCTDQEKAEIDEAFADRCK
jgi:hypothetical protein